MSALDAFLKKVVTEIVNPVLLLLAAVAFVLFIWGVVKFIMHAEDGTARKEGREAIMWGLIGLGIIFGVYGILDLVTSTFNDVPSVQRITGLF